MSNSDLLDLFNDYNKGNIDKSDAIRNLLVIIEQDCNNELKNEALEYLIRLGSDLAVLKALERLFLIIMKTNLKSKSQTIIIKVFSRKKIKRINGIMFKIRIRKLIYL